MSNSENELDKKLNVTKILSFVNNDFSNLYLKVKGLDLTIQKETIMGEKNNLKRKSNLESEAKNNKTKNNKEVECPKNQKTILGYFKK